MTDEEATAQRSISQGAKWPYDGECSPVDWAHLAARGVIYDLSDRRGIKNGILGVEDIEVRREIVASLAAIIREAAP